jgi:hypothetical protein
MCFLAGIFFLCGYGFGQVIPSRFLTIVISTGNGYPPGSGYPMGTTMSINPYPRTYMGTSMDWILSHGYGFTNHISVSYLPDCHPYPCSPCRRAPPCPHPRGTTPLPRCGPLHPMAELAPPLSLPWQLWEERREVEDDICAKRTLELHLNVRRYLIY